MRNGFKEEFIKIALDEDTLKNAISGFGAGATSAILLQPLNIAKTLQETTYPNESILDITKKLYNTGGLSRFFVGSGAQILKNGLGMGIILGTAPLFQSGMEKIWK